MTKTIYVAGYPESGIAWFARLLGDALDRSNDYVIHKGHFTLFEGKAAVTVPVPNVLAWKNLLENEFVVFLVRDPRNIVVSGAYHWKVNPETFLSWMCKGTNEVRSFGSWRVYIRRWLNANFTYFITSYELLHKDESKVLISLFNAADLPYDAEFVKTAAKRQSLTARKKDIKKSGKQYPLGRKPYKRFMQKDVVGDWKTVFTPAMTEKAQKYFGTLMEEFGYV